MTAPFIHDDDTGIDAFILQERGNGSNDNTCRHDADETVIRPPMFAKECRNFLSLIRQKKRCALKAGGEILGQFFPATGYGNQGNPHQLPDPLR